jgi:hypothetical protein
MKFIGIDFYHKYKEDIKLFAKIGFRHNQKNDRPVRLPVLRHTTSTNLPNGLAMS